MTNDVLAEKKAALDKAVGDYVAASNDPSHVVTGYCLIITSLDLNPEPGETRPRKYDYLFGDGMTWDTVEGMIRRCLRKVIAISGGS